MLNHPKTLALSLLAAFALCALVASSASAAGLPALYECAKTTKVNKKYTGKYNDKKCSSANEKGEGKYELKEGIGKGKAFKGKGGAANLEIEGVGGVRCSKSADTGKFNTPKTADDVNVTFSGCVFETHTCSNTGKAGEIKTNPLKGEVGYLEGEGTEHPVIGERLQAETGEYEAEFQCGELFFRVEGSVIGEAKASDVNVFTKEATLIFRESSGKQQWRSFEGLGESDVLLTEKATEKFGAGKGAKANSAESTESTQKGEELELKA
jgi:hypothetical protein